MRNWNAERVAAAAGAELVRAPADDAGPLRATIDSRRIEPGDLFVGLAGERVDGAAFAADALRAGAWGALVGRGGEAAALGAARSGAGPPAPPARCSSRTTLSPRSSASPPPGARSSGRR